MALQLWQATRFACCSSLRLVSTSSASLKNAQPGDDTQARFDQIMQDMVSSSDQPEQPEQPEHSGTQPGAPEQSASTRSGEPSTSYGPSTSVDAEPHQQLVDSKYGYAVLGGIDPSEQSDWRLQTPKVNPLRDFKPGDTYVPQDLNPFYDAPDALWKPGSRPHIPPDNRSVYAMADYKHTDFLRQFVSSSGRLLPRKKTKLKPAVHKHVMRQVKIARVMALMPHESRIGDEQRKRLRQFELLQSRMRFAGDVVRPEEGAAVGLGGVAEALPPHGEVVAPV